MTKKVIQVPIDEQLLFALDRLSRRQGKARAGVIREACRCYLAAREAEELDAEYRRGYEELPEESELAEAQVALAGETLSRESW